jgi:hypothetical protein
MESALKKFANVDGQYGRLVMPFPHSESHNPEAAKYDKMSVADRIAQIKDDLSPDEHTALLGTTAMSTALNISSSTSSRADNRASPSISSRKLVRQEDCPTLSTHRWLRSRTAEVMSK